MENSLIKYRVGEEIYNEDSGSRQTLGACVTRGSASGFITTAHGNNIGDKMVGIAGDSFGTVNKLQMGGSVDAVYIKKGNNDNIDLTDKVRISSSNPNDLGTITSAGAPPAEGAVIRFGNTTGYSIAVIVSNDWEGEWDGQLDPDNYYTNMIQFDIGSEGGDSGGPCMSPLGNDRYKLVGITKGTLNSGDGIATRWDNIEDEFGVSIY